MSVELCTYLEHRTDRGWVLAGRSHFRKLGRGWRDLDYNPSALYLLTGKVWGLDPKGLPPPLVGAPRGLPPDCAPQLRELCQHDSDPVSWVSIEELLLHDWEHAMWYPTGPAHDWLVPLLDDLCQLRPPRDYRLSFWMS